MPQQGEPATWNQTVRIHFDVNDDYQLNEDKEMLTVFGRYDLKWVDER